MAECKTCKHKGTSTHICDECTSDYSMYEKKVVTNADAIRGMTDEELAELFTKLAWNSEVQTTPLKYLDWLQSEAERVGD